LEGEKKKGDRRSRKNEYSLSKRKKTVPSPFREKRGGKKKTLELFPATEKLPTFGKIAKRKKREEKSPLPTEKKKGAPGPYGKKEKKKIGSGKGRGEGRRSVRTRPNKIVGFPGRKEKKGRKVLEKRKKRLHAHQKKTKKNKKKKKQKTFVKILTREKEKVLRGGKKKKGQFPGGKKGGGRESYPPLSKNLLATIRGWEGKEPRRKRTAAPRARNERDRVLLSREGYCFRRGRKKKKEKIGVHCWGKKRGGKRADEGTSHARETPSKGKKVLSIVTLV